MAAIGLVACGGGSPDGGVVMDSLSQPRGLATDDSWICVAEAGRIGEQGPTRERPGQLEADTGRVICSPRPGGEPAVRLADLPFVYYPDAAVTSGAADVILDGDLLYVLVGESFGDLARSIVAVEQDGPRVVADLLAHAESLSAGAGGLFSNPYSFVSAPDGAGFFVADAASGTVLRAGLDGTVETFASVPGHEVLTGITWGPDGDLYVASFGQLPHPPGTGAIVAVDSSGNHRVVVDGLTMAIDVGFDATGGMLILEYSSPPDEPGGVDAYRDGSGRLLYWGGEERDGGPVVVLDGLNRPTALSVDGERILISVTGGEAAGGNGSVVEYRLGDLLASR